MSGLNQEPCATEKKAMVDGAPGHGCGHNMLGTASLSAAIGLKKYLEETGKSGTVIYFGCPGEEGGSGKAFMAKGGVFEGLDAAITWHPGDLTRADTGALSPTIRYIINSMEPAPMRAERPTLEEALWTLDRVLACGSGSKNPLRDHQ